jgi:hypothetical protein
MQLNRVSYNSETRAARQSKGTHNKHAYFYQELARVVKDEEDIGYSLARLEGGRWVRRLEDFVIFNIIFPGGPQLVKKSARDTDYISRWEVMKEEQKRERYGAVIYTPQL